MVRMVDNTCIITQQYVVYCTVYVNVEVTLYNTVEPRS